MRPWMLIVLGVALACGPGAAGDDLADTTQGTTASAGSTGQIDGATSVAMTTDGGSSGSGSPTGGGSSTADDGSESTADTSGGACDPTAPPSCGNYVYVCGNGLDDDGDGWVDLDDPDCLGPCDDSEDVLSTGIPGDSMSCSHDCFFDGNYGIGDDGCRWDPRCDPLDPAAELGCGYDPGVCPPPPWPDPRVCLLVCPPLVPNGCDCFGCCVVELGGSSQAVYLDDLGCSVATLDACSPCTPQLEACGNPCDPEQCEICFPNTEPPEGCERAGCPDAAPCDDHCDCEPDGYCLQGCCHPNPAP